MKKNKLGVFTILILVVMILYCLSMFILLGWGFAKSLQSESDFIMQGATAISWPREWTLANYINAFDKIKYKLPIAYGGDTIYFEEMFLNSLIYSVGCPLAGLISTTMMAYITTRYDMKFNKVVTFIVWFCMMVPIYGSLPSSIQLMTELGLINTWRGIFIKSFGFANMNFLLISASLKGLSKEYGEAALIDGASRLKIMLKIDIPLIKTTLAVLFVMGFIGCWNDYQTPMIYLPSKITASYGLYIFNKAGDSYFDYLIYKMSGFMLLCIPTLFLFLIFKDKMIGSLTVGGLKG